MLSVLLSPAFALTMPTGAAKHEQFDRAPNIKESSWPSPPKTRSPRRATKTIPSGISRSCARPTWPRTPPSAAAWSSSRGATRSGRTSSGRSTRMFKATGHENAYFPLFIPLSFLEKEAEHVEGFAKECAVVTHHRLEAGPDGRLGSHRPAGRAADRAARRARRSSARCTPSGCSRIAICRSSSTSGPTSCAGNCGRGCFLRTTEFLWQEGHTAHATRGRGQRRDAADARRVRRRSPKTTWRCR